MFIRRKTYDELVKQRDYLQNWKDVTSSLENAQAQRMIRLENEQDEILAFVRFLQESVPDYEKYILDFMDKQESEDGSST